MCDLISILNALAGEEYRDVEDYRTAVRAIGALSRMETERPRGEWITEIDTGSEMLKCPPCGRRVVEKWYRLAVGTSADRCPYCGCQVMMGDK